MKIASRQDFLACLDRTDRASDAFGVAFVREVCAFCKPHLLTAVDEVGFHDFFGEDYEVLNRLSCTLSTHSGESALWGLVFLDIWYCNNFGGKQWSELVKRDATNIRFAIRVAYWVLMVSGADSASSLARIINQHDCWDVAYQWIRQGCEDDLRAWWYDSVLPLRVMPGANDVRPA
jgi:hypothetical protein